jgi:predicted RNA-binding protein
MCLSKAYVETGGQRELLMEEVASLGFDKDKLRLKTLFGEEKEIAANIKEIDFMTHAIILEKSES